MNSEWCNRANQFLNKCKISIGSGRGSPAAAIRKAWGLTIDTINRASIGYHSQTDVTTTLADWGLPGTMRVKLIAGIVIPTFSEHKLAALEIMHINSASQPMIVPGSCDVPFILFGSGNDCVLLSTSLDALLAYQASQYTLTCIARYNLRNIDILSESFVNIYSVYNTAESQKFTHKVKYRPPSNMPMTLTAAKVETNKHKNGYNQYGCLTPEEWYKYRILNDPITCNKCTGEHYKLCSEWIGVCDLTGRLQLPTSYCFCPQYL